MYKLTSENLTHLGGPMGSEYTYPNWEKFFSSEEKAQAYAEKDYASRPIAWIRTGKRLCSPDLGYVMYTIEKVEVID